MHRIKNKSLIGLVMLLVLFISVSGSQAESDIIDFADLGKRVGLSDPQISPNGKSIVVVSSRSNYEENRFENHLYLVDVQSGKKRPLTYNRYSVRQPRWSPSGDRLAFVALDKDKKPQVFVMEMKGGEANQITNTLQGVKAFSWRPDGRALAFSTEDTPEKREGEEKHNKSFKVGSHVYLASSASMPTHLWITSSDGGEAKQLTSGPHGIMSYFGIISFDWSLDGQSIVYTAQPTPHSGGFYQCSLKLLDIESGKQRELVPGPKTLFAPRFSPDGNRIAYIHPRGREPLFNPSSVFIIPASGGNSVDAAAQIDRHVSGIWMPDSKSLLVSGPDITRVSVWYQPLEREQRKLSLGKIIPQGNLSVDREGIIVFIASEPNLPPEVYTMASLDSPPLRLTDFNEELASRTMGWVETIHWEGPDGFKENGVLVFPPDFKKDNKYPLVLEIHGGPMSASTEAFSLTRQLLAAQDWIIFSPNYRGSSNQGRDFQRAVMNDAGKGPGKDVMAGIAAVKKRGFVDETRVAVSGWSYGGFMTSWLIAHYSGWKAAVAGAAVTDWFDWYNLTDMNNWAGFGLGGSPWLNNNMDNYWKQSPIAYAHQIRTPTLILSNTRDPRVTVTQSYKLYHALKDNGVAVEFIAYPVDGHFPGDPIHQRDVWRRWIEWINKYFKSTT